jgi:putative ABC transport system permease protein
VVVRKVHVVSLMANLLQEIRCAVRMFRRSPGPAVAAVITLALGIGANTAIFSLANASMWKPIPLLDVENIIMALERAPQDSSSAAPVPVGWDPVTPGNFFDWKEQSRTFGQLTACKYASFNIGAAGGDPERVVGAKAAADYLGVFGVSPALGRWFTADEDQPGRDAVIVLGYGIWQRRFGGDPRALGSTMVVEGRGRTVIGVMPKDFNFPLGAGLWTPLAMTAEQRRSRALHELFVLGRLSPGIDRGQAAAEMQAIASRLERAYPDTNKGWGTRVMPLRNFVLPDPTRRMWYILMGTMLLVLMVACVNVANLQLARLASRMHEMGVRTAMGAGTGRLVRQLLTESMLLSSAGATLGVLIALWVADMLTGLMPAELSRYITWDTRLDPRTLIFTAGIAVLAGVASGVAPAFHCSRPDTVRILREGGRGTSGSRSRQRLAAVLVVAQVACTMVLLVGSALCVQSFQRMGGDPDGIDPASLLVLRMNLNETTYALPHQRRAFARELVERAQALPGVESAVVMNIAPHTWQTLASPFTIEGRQEAVAARQRFSTVEAVGPDYFRTMRIPLREGRSLTNVDGPEGPGVAVVSEGLARRYFANESAIGRKVKLKIGGEWLTIVGVAADFHQHGYDREPRPVVYVPYAQMPTAPLDLALRVSGENAAALLPAAQSVVRAMDPQQPVYEARTLTQIIEVWELFGMRLAAHMMGALGLLALVLASVGLYGVLSYAVRQRTHEIGIRIALGATLAAVQVPVVRRGLMLGGLGLAIGLAVSLVATRAIASLLFGIGATDPATFAAASLMLLAIAFLASYLPAWRAARVDPVEALRHE